MLWVENISKYYRSHRAIKNLSFNVRQGTILGIAGSNGAGKTTLMRILATLLTPTSGYIYFQQRNMGQKEPLNRHLIGYMPEDASHYLRLNAIENLSFHMSFYTGNNIREKIEFYLKKFDLWNVREKAVGQFSKGMKQKLLFISSVIHEPALILLDEPFTALDPTARNRCKTMLDNFRAAQKSIIVSSHSLFDLAILCDHILILNKGTPVLYESIQTIQMKIKEAGAPDIETYYLRLMENL